MSGGNGIDGDDEDEDEENTEKSTENERPEIIAWIQVEASATAEREK